MMRLDWPVTATEVRSLSRWGGAGVGGYGLSLGRRPRTRFATQIELSPLGRGELNPRTGRFNQNHSALGNFRTIHAACRRTIPERIAVRPAAVSAGGGTDVGVRHHGL